MIDSESPFEIWHIEGDENIIENKMSSKKARKKTFQHSQYKENDNKRLK